MKPRLFPTRLATAITLAASTAALHAQTTTWTGATNGEWGAPANWDNGVPDATGAVANINNAHTVNLTSPDTGYTFGTLATNIASGSVVIGTTAGTTDVLTAAVSSGKPLIHVANGSANIFFYANLEGSQGFEKTGAGKLTFRFNGSDQNYSGDILISGGILGIHQNSSLGDDNNDITIANGARLLAEPGSNSGIITLPSSRTITLTGAQSQIGSNNANVNLVINGTVTEDAAGKGLVKTDGGVVTLAGTLGYTGETRIAGGTLALSGPAALPTGQNLRFNGTTGTLNLGGTSQTVRTIVMDNTAGNKSITGGGSLTINGDANQQLSAANGVNYDFSGLDAFTYNRANREFKLEMVNAAATTSLADLNLAKSGAGGGTNNITAGTILIGGGNSDGNNGSTARLHLGTTNNLNTTTFRIGAFNAGGIVDFQSGLSAPSLKLRGTDGSSATTTWTIGETSSGSRRGEGVVNLTGGTLDALVTNLRLGRHIAGANLADTSSLTMPGGSLTAETITMAEKTGGGTPTLTTTLNQGGGTVSTNSLTLGLGTGTEAARLLPTYNLSGGTLLAATINATGTNFAANSLRSLNLAGGTLRNLPGNDLGINGIDATVGGRIHLNANAASTLHADASQSVTLGTNTALTGSADLAKTGTGTLVLNGSASTYLGTLSIQAGTVGGATTLGGALALTSAGALAPGNSIGTLGAASLTWDGGGLMSFELGDTDNSSDLLALAGAFSKGTTGLWSFDFNNSGLAGETYTLVTFASTDFSVGDFTYSNLSSGQTGSFGLDSGSLTFTVVPEPSAVLLALFGGLLTLRRHRRPL